MGRGPALFHQGEPRSKAVELALAVQAFGQCLCPAFDSALLFQDLLDALPRVVALYLGQAGLHLWNQLQPAKNRFDQEGN